MKATTRDQETLRTVRPLELVSFLRAQGRRQVSEFDVWEKPFRDHGQYEEVGVSANSCDPVVGLERVSSSEGGEVGIPVSRNRPLAGHAQSTFLFSPDMVPLFGEASCVFKETEPREDIEIEGFVIDLHRDEGAPTGRVVVTALIEKDIHKVAIELDENEHTVALRDHGGERRIRCTGDLAKQERIYRLLNPDILPSRLSRIDLSSSNVRI